MRSGRVYWSWNENGEQEDMRRAMSWCFRMPLVKNGVEWGWLNLYHDIDGESLLVDINYLSNLFLRELTEAVTRIISAHESTAEEREISIAATASQVGR